MKNRFEIDGDLTRIYLKRKKGPALVTLIDTRDLPTVDSSTSGTWCAQWSSFTESFYVVGYKRWTKKEITAGQKRGRLLLHRVITDCPAELQVDHINHQTLDNRRANLRIVTASENGKNRRRPRSHTRWTNAKGYRFDKKWKRFIAYVTTADGKRIFRQAMTEAEIIQVRDALRREYPVGVYSKAPH
jgi:hypothetical protein